MKFINQEKSSFSIEITPLIDIVFLLVIFFVVTSKVGDSQFLSLDLPKTESFEYSLVEINNEISVTSGGNVSIIIKKSLELVRSGNCWSPLYMDVEREAYLT